jgi:hypothetical protein
MGFGEKILDYRKFHLMLVNPKPGGKWIAGIIASQLIGRPIPHIIRHVEPKIFTG